MPDPRDSARTEIVSLPHRRDDDRTDINLNPNAVESEPRSTESADSIGERISNRYELHSEIGRGGMGSIHKGRDTDLGRDLAIKVLLEDHKDEPAVVQRFIEEAQIGGQLQHPGIVPVYELGQLADDRPFFTMKLVKGRTLAELLAARPSLDSDRAKYIGIFLQICQTLAYAHSRNVVHRDLKPGNIMVGAFGEVQVMDWGLAKVLTSASAKSDHDSDIIRTVRRPFSEGRRGSPSQSTTQWIMGTPAYMAPEQALGKVNDIDQRTDVFGLGGILCEILTGSPPYTGPDANETMRRAIIGQLDSCFGKLDASSADPELIELAKRCLRPAPADRPSHAGELAERVSTYLASVDHRLRAAEIERAAEAARADEALHTVAEAQAKTRAERRAKRLQVRLALLLVAVTGLAGIAATWVAFVQSRLKNDAQTAERNALTAKEAEAAQRRRADAMLADMETSRGLLAAEPAEAAMWFVAAAKQATLAEDPERHESNRLRARNWLRTAPIPVAVATMAGEPMQLEFTSGDNLVLARDAAQTAMLWSWRERRLLPWIGKLTGVTAVRLDPTGDRIAIGYVNGMVDICRMPDGQPLDHFQIGGSVGALAFSADGSQLAIGGQMVRIWDCKLKALREQKWRHPRPVTAMRFGNEDKRLFTMSTDLQVRIINAAEPDDRPLIALPHAVNVHSLVEPPAVIDEGRSLVTINGERESLRWNLTVTPPTFDRIATRPRLLGFTASSHGGRRFAAAGYNGLEFFSAADNRPLFELGHTNIVLAAHENSDLMMAVTGSMDRTARVWSLTNGRPISPPIPHAGQINRCALSADGRFVATAQSNGLSVVWRMPRESIVIPIDDGWAQRPRLSGDGQWIAQGTWNESFTIWETQRTVHVRVRSAEDGLPAGPPIPLPGSLVDSVICPDNRGVAAVFEDGPNGRFQVWNFADGQARFDSVLLPAPPVSVDARPNGSQVAVYCGNGELLVFDANSGQIVYRVFDEKRDPTFRANRGRVRYSPDGRTLVTLEIDGLGIRARDAATGESRWAPIKPGLRPIDRCRSFAISSDSRHLATIVNGRNAAQVWNLETGQPECAPLLHPGDEFGLFSCCFSPDGRRLLTGCKDGQARCWDWKTGELTCPPLTNNDEVYDVAFTPDGRHALTTLRLTPHVNLWELTTGRRVAPPIVASPVAGRSTHTLAVTPDGRKVLVGVSHDYLTVLNLEPLLRPADKSADDYGVIAELASARRIEKGDVSGLSADDWLAKARQLASHGNGLSNESVIDRPTTRKRMPLLADTAEFKAFVAETLEKLESDKSNRHLWYHAATLLAAAQDRAAYREVCRRAAAQFEGSVSPTEADTVSKMCLLWPEAEPGVTLPIQVLLATVDQGRADPGLLNWFHTDIGLYHYRHGRFPDALSHLDKSSRHWTARGPERALALATSAMCQARMGDFVTARRALAESMELTPPKMVRFAAGQGPLQRDHTDADWLAAMIVQNEARELLIQLSMP